MTHFIIDPATTMGTVYLTITSMDRALRFYVDILGFRPQARQTGIVALTADGETPLIVLRAQPAARPRPAHDGAVPHRPARAQSGRTGTDAVAVGRG
ncbi:MAG: hypothetical protein HZY76_02205 [Anaerolineae bacterium]|nr:MAG: hypothetical protein HZY76_02205 [Anaerolineae bacterium]